MSMLSQASNKIQSPAKFTNYGVAKSAYILLVVGLFTSIYFYIGILRLSSRLPFWAVIVVMGIASLSGAATRGVVKIPVIGYLLLCHILVTGFFRTFADIYQFGMIVNIVGVVLCLHVGFNLALNSWSFIGKLLVLTAVLYVLVFYFVALSLGMRGIAISDQLLRGDTSYIGQYFPSVNAWVVNGRYPPGRGQFGVMGFVALLAALFPCIPAFSRRPVRLLLGSIGLFGILICDTRAITTALAIVLLCAFLPLVWRRKAFLLCYLPPLIFAGSLIFTFVTRYETGNAHLDINVLKRSNATILNQRELIWPIVWDNVLAGTTNLFFGYGEILSQKKLIEVFSALDSVESGFFDSAHNFSLQMLYDYGIIGWTLFLSILVYIGRVLKKISLVAVRSKWLFVAMLHLFLSLYGMTNSLFGLGRMHELQVIGIMLVSITAALRETNDV